MSVADPAPTVAALKVNMSNAATTIEARRTTTVVAHRKTSARCVR
jgi:hypothetical protein